MEITKDTIIGDIIDNHAEVIQLLMGGKHRGCPSARGETVEEACAVHGADVNAFLARLNEAVNK